MFEAKANEQKLDKKYAEKFDLKKIEDVSWKH